MKNGNHFRPTAFKLMETEDKLTTAAGLATIMEVFDQTGSDQIPGGTSPSSPFVKTEGR